MAAQVAAHRVDQHTEPGAVHQDAVRSAHNTTCLGHCVKGRAIGPGDLLARGDRHDPWSCRQRCSRLRRYRRRGHRHRQGLGVCLGQDLEAVEDARQRRITANKCGQFNQPLRTMRVEQSIEGVLVNTITAHELTRIADDGRFVWWQSGQCAVITGCAQGGLADATLARLARMCVPDIGAVALARGGADGEFGKPHVDDGLAMQKLALVVPWFGQAGAVHHHAGRPAEPSAHRRQFFIERVMFGCHVFLGFEQLYARHGESPVDE